MKNSKFKNAFTLVELSVVLIIISLIIGGIIFGSNLIKSSRFIAITNEINQYRSAINNFVQKYNAFPGDIPNSTTFWPNCNSASGDGGVCDGNGDGVIGCNPLNTGCASSYETTERLRAWQHMSLAGLLNTNYTGFSTNGNFNFGIDTPLSKYPNAGYILYKDSCYNTGNHYLYLSARAFGNILTPQDASIIDSKIDDGNPITGIAIASSPDSAISSSCSTTAASACFAASSSKYYVNYSSATCLLAFKY